MQPAHHPKVPDARHEALFRASYGASIAVLQQVVPFMDGRGGEATELARGVKAVPRLIAAALCGSVAPERQRRALEEAARLSREAVVALSYCRDLRGRFINGGLCAELIAAYRTIDAELTAALAREGLSPGEGA